MHNVASSSQSSINVSGSGALSHVYIEDPPLRCSIPGCRGLFYDDGNRLLLSPTLNEVFTWKVAPFNPLTDPTSDSVSEGPVLSIRYSLDLKILAILRSRYEIQFRNKNNDATFSHRCNTESESILGFFWTDCSTCNLVIVKTSGLDLMICDAESQGLRLVESKRVTISWYVYSHESRLLLLASGMQCKSFTGFQLSSAGIIRLPKFDMMMAKSEANNKPVLDAEDIHVITVYGRIYCLQVDRLAMLLHCYRFYRDAVMQQGSLPIYSSKVAVNVVDNVLLVHQVDAKVVILYDLYADSRAPISAPLPLLLRGYHPIKDDGSVELKQTNNKETILYGDGWKFIIPDLVCDTTSGLLWKIHLDLDAISTSSSDVPSVFEFLQRRKLEAKKAKELCLTLARTIISERRPVFTVAQAMDSLITSYSHALKTGTYCNGVNSEKTPSCSQHVTSLKINPSATIGTESFNQSSAISDSDSEEGISSVSSTGKMKVGPSSVGPQLPGPSGGPLDVNGSERSEPQIGTPAISPDEVYCYVFGLVDDEMGGDPVYLVAIIIEFLRSANSERIRIYPNIYVLLIQLLVRSERYMELSLFIFDKIIEPSKEVAYQLVECGRQHTSTRKLGMDMLRQLGLHHDYVLLLAQDGHHLEALRYARKLKVVTIEPKLFLEAAHASHDSQRLATVLRFFSDFIPSFKTTTDHATYCHILSQMNTSISA